MADVIFGALMIIFTVFAAVLVFLGCFAVASVLHDIFANGLEFLHLIALGIFLPVASAVNICILAFLGDALL